MLSVQKVDSLFWLGPWPQYATFRGAENEETALALGLADAVEKSVDANTVAAIERENILNKNSK